jgi:hypothetical protein
MAGRSDEEPPEKQNAQYHDDSDDYDLNQTHDENPRWLTVGRPGNHGFDGAYFMDRPP